MTRPTKPANWNLIYFALIVGSLFVTAVGQWGAGITGLALTLILGRLVLIERHLSVISTAPVDPAEVLE